MALITLPPTAGPLAGQEFDLPERYYPTADYRRDWHEGAAGWWTDHRDRGARLLAYELRRMQAPDGTKLLSQKAVARMLRVQHWLRINDMCRAVRDERHGRGSHPLRERDDRTWRRRSYRSYQEAREAVPGQRAFGVEIEFNVPEGVSTMNVRAAIDRGMPALVGASNWTSRWDRWSWDARIGGWQGTYDSTVNGGELITPPLDGSPESFDQLAGVMALVREAGATWKRVPYYSPNGLHVSHDVTDFDRSDLLRLVDNLQAQQHNLLSYLSTARRNSGWCQPLDDYEWGQVRRSVSGGHAPVDNHNIAFNFGSCFATGGAARVEWRGWGFSLNGSKLKAWIKVGQAFMAATKAGVRFSSGTDVSDLLTTLREHGLSTWASDKFAARCGNVAAVAA